MPGRASGSPTSRARKCRHSPTSGVRQAINFAIDRESIFTTLYGGIGAVTNQPFSRASPSTTPRSTTPTPTTPRRRRSSSPRAGYADGFTIPTFGTAFVDSLQPTIEANLAAIGITVTFEREPIENLFGGGYNDYPMYFWYYGAISSRG